MIAGGSNVAGGKSELHRAGCQPTAGGGDPEESATEKQTAVLVVRKGDARGKGEKVR